MAAKAKTPSPVGRPSRRPEAERRKVDRDWTKFCLSETDAAIEDALKAHDRADAALRQSRAAVLAAQSMLRRVSKS